MTLNNLEIFAEPYIPQGNYYECTFRFSNLVFVGHKFDFTHLCQTQMGGYLAIGSYLYVTVFLGEPFNKFWKKKKIFLLISLY